MPPWPLRTTWANNDPFRPLALMSWASCQGGNRQPDNPLETMSSAHARVSVSCFLGSWGEVTWGPRTPWWGLRSRQWPQDGGPSRDLPVREAGWPLGRQQQPGPGCPPGMEVRREPEV